MNHRARKRFGQNFLVDPNLVDRIVRSIAPKPDQHLVEIGPGQAAMTAPLLASGCRLTAIEIDRDLAAALRSRPDLDGLEIIEQDVLQLDLTRLETPVRLVGNLPYNISSPILFWALDQLDHVIDMHFMLQNEVVDRIAAAPGCKAYGRLSVMVQFHCEVEKLFVVPPHVFRPAPKVDSAIVRLQPRFDRPQNVDMTGLAGVVKAAFAMRRKTLANNLKGILGRPQIEATGIDPGVRAETLTVDDFVRLSRALD